jgi:hypothetical protein
MHSVAFASEFLQFQSDKWRIQHGRWQVDEGPDDGIAMKDKEYGVQ